MRSLPSRPCTRLPIFLVHLLAGAGPAFANDWGVGQANSAIPPASILRPVSTPAHEITTLALFAVAVTTMIFVIVSGLLTYSVVRFRSRRADDGIEPRQVYGSGAVEFAWTAVPVLIVFVLLLTTVRSVYTDVAAITPPSGNERGGRGVASAPLHADGR
jgi:cytochrome c oxidase subunit 2